MRGLVFGMSTYKDVSGAIADPKPVRPNPLEAYFDANLQGPGIWKWRHYFEAYHRHFQKFVGKEVHILEIGVFSGGSMAMWKNYFGPNCRVYGVDIREECKSYEADSIKILIGDQGNRQFWKSVREQVPRLDIVVDDGSHFTEHQIVSVEEMLPHLHPGGVYMVEDTYSVLNGFHDYAAGLARNISGWGSPKPGVPDPHGGQIPEAFQRSVGSVHLYPYLTVFEKHENPPAEFSAPRHGSQWIPWIAAQNLNKPGA